MNSCSQPGYQPGKHCLVPAVHKILVFLMRRGVSLSCSSHCSTDRGQRGWTVCGLKAAEGCLPTQASSLTLPSRPPQGRCQAIQGSALQTWDWKVNKKWKCTVTSSVLFCFLSQIANQAFVSEEKKKRLQEREGVSVFIPIPPSPLTFCQYLSCMEHLFPGSLTDLGNSTLVTISFGPF